MDAGSLSKLVALLGSLGVALLVTWLLTRHERRQRQPRALVAGYPPGEFPRRERIEGPLASLCQSQESLLALFRELPSAPARAHLLVFLEQLRALMDGAYALAALRASAEAQKRLEQLAHDVRRAAEQVLETTQRHASDSSDGLGAGLEWRVEVLKALARDLDEPRAPPRAPSVK
jgi:hypothetical protein